LPVCDGMDAILFLSHSYLLDVLGVCVVHPALRRYKSSHPSLDLYFARYPRLRL
jgi:hypothetical protein